MGGEAGENCKPVCANGAGCVAFCSMSMAGSSSAPPRYQLTRHRPRVKGVLGSRKRGPGAAWLTTDLALANARTRESRGTRRPPCMQRCIRSGSLRCRC